MTSTDTTVKGQREAISFDFELPHAPEKVWRALTDPELLTEWLLPVVDLDFDLAPGSEFTLRTQSQPGWDGTVSCEILEVDPRQKLSYAWRVPFLDTVVTFTLTPTASGTHLSIVQSGFKPDQKREFGGARYGWKMMGGRLVDLLASLP
jgi:uncharacterized protein YndB with AHSA1/START domain